MTSPASTVPTPQPQEGSTTAGLNPSGGQPTALESPSTPENLERPPLDQQREQTQTSGSRDLLCQAARSGVGRVRADLDRFGPEQTIRPMAVDEAFAYCRELAQVHYENFSVVTKLVPVRIRPHLASIYAYCRWSDDLADEMGDPSQATELLQWWRGQLEACFAGHATHPVFIALRQTVSQYRLQSEPFHDLLSAFLQDQTQTRYQSDNELLRYCERSANPVGRLVVRLAQLSSSQAIAWSDSICTGLQLANFCQDIRLDAKRGRFYWPADRLLNSGVAPEVLALDAPITEACRGVMAWGDHARSYLCAGLPLVQHGPLWFARSVQLFVRGGLLILRNIDLQQGDVWSRGVIVTKSQKLRLLIRSLLFPRSVHIASCDMSLSSIDPPRLDA